MQEDKSKLVKSAMSYGFALGIYWIIKYAFFLFSSSALILSSIYYGLTLAVPFIAYYLTKKYKQDIGGRIGFFHAWQFGVLLYFFAAIVVSLEHYVFYRYLAPPDLLTTTMDQVAELYKNQVTPETLDTMKDIITNPMHMTLIDIFSNTLYGIIFSIPVAAFLFQKGDGTGVVSQENQNEIN